MIELEAIIPKDLAIRFRDEPAMMNEIGTAARKLLQARIEGPNVDADGRPLPKLSRRLGWFTTADDVRVQSVDGMRYYRTHDRRDLERVELGEAKEIRVAVRKRGNTYDTEKRTTTEGVGIYWPGYEALKGRRAGTTKRGASFTGAMWASLKLYVGRKRTGKNWEPTVRFAFTGSEIQGFVSGENYKSGKPKKNRVNNRLKARMLQYSRRKKDGSPAGSPDFRLVMLNQEEIGKVMEIISRHVRVTSSGPSAG